MNFIKSVLFLMVIGFSFNAFAESKSTPVTPSQESIQKTPTDDELLRQLILKIESIELNIKTKFADISPLQGEERAVMGIQILDLDKDIKNEIESAVVLFLRIKQSSADVSAYKKSLHRSLNRRSKQLYKIYKYIERLVDELTKQSPAVNVSERFVFEQKLNTSRHIISDIFLSLQHVIDTKFQLEIDNNHDIRVFSQLLKDVSSEMSSKLKIASSQIKNKKKEIANSSDAGKKDLELELNALNEKRNGISDGISLVITLMQKHNINTAKLSQLLITSSGTINQQIFDKEVVTGLVVQWTNQLEKWFMLNASSFLVSTLIIILILVVFRLISHMTGRLISKGFSSSKVKISKLLREFIVVSVRRLVMFIGMLIALSQTGVELGPLLAGLGVLGFVVGFALQGVLSNFASGMMILIYRPYDVGDVVEIAKVKGTVQEMSMVSTTLLSFSNERLVIPNNSIWGSLIRNITSESTRRVDLVFKISFDADIDQLDKIFTEEVNAISAVLPEPAPTIELHKQHETHLEFIVRPWVKTSDYWSTYWALNKAIQLRMVKEGVPKLNPYEFLRPLIK